MRGMNRKSKVGKLNALVVLPTSFLFQRWLCPTIIATLTIGVMDIGNIIYFSCTGSSWNYCLVFSTILPVSLIFSIRSHFIKGPNMFLAETLIIYWMCPNSILIILMIMGATRTCFSVSKDGAVQKVVSNNERKRIPK
jgi:hypothetical protein